MKGYRLDKIMHTLVKIASFFSMISIFLILFFIFKETLPVLTSSEINKEVSLETMFTSQPKFHGAGNEFKWEPTSSTPRYSVIPLLVGTLKATLVAMCVSVPLAVLSAIYVVEFAPPTLREIIKPCIELLAGIPSVIIGLLGLMIIGTIFQDVFHFTYRLNATLAGFCLSFATIPIIFTLTEDSLTAAPYSYREAALALGAYKIDVIFKIVLPVATPGIVAAIMLGFGRAIGETMIVLMTSGNTPLLSLNFAMPIRTISATIASEMPEVSVGSAHYHVLFFLGTLLFGFTFLTNLIGKFFINRMKRKLEG